LGLQRERLDQAVNKPTKEENATQLASRARTVAGIADMNTAHAGMQSYEEDLKKGRASINGLEQITGRMANSFTHDDPVSQTLQSATLSILDKQNPALARYLRQGLTFAEGESMISQRPSDFRTKMATFLSTAASGATPELINDIQHRRVNMLSRLNPLFPEESASAGTTTTGSTAFPMVFPGVAGSLPPKTPSAASSTPSAPTASPYEALIPSGKGQKRP
jgi:hypothetical protein